jgi:hypothetical protein
MEYAPNMEYRYTRETKCGNAVINHYVDAWVKWR